MQRFWRDERGSVIAAGLAAATVVALLALAIIEHTWVKHVLRSAQETADFAAEAGAAVFEEYARVTVDRRELYLVWWQECMPYPDHQDEEGNPICWWDSDTRERWSYPVVSGRVQDLQATWRQLFECVDDPWQGWQCSGRPRVVSPERANRWLEYLPQTAAHAESTFRANWEDRRGASLEQLNVTYLAGARTVWVHARIRIVPVALAFLPARTLTVTGHGQSMLGELAF